MVWCVLTLKNFGYYYLKYFLCSSFSFFYFGILTMYMLHLFKLSHCTLMSCFVFCILFSHFSRRNFYWPFIKLTPLSLAIFSTLMCPSKVLFIFVSVFFFSSIFLYPYLRVSISLLTFPIYACMLLTFYFRVLNILIIVMLNFLYDNSNIFAISESHSDTCFVSSDCDFSCLLTFLMIFC